MSRPQPHFAATLPISSHFVAEVRKDTDRPSVRLLDLGRLPYAEAWDMQTRIHQSLVDHKRALWQGTQPVEAPEHTFMLCEHDPVFTLGKSGSEDNLRLDAEGLQREGFSFFKINRGGDITYHGPGQIVGYPILDLEAFYCDVHRYVRELEEVIIRTLGDYSLASTRLTGYTGVWLEPSEGRPWRKICAIGVHLSRWVSLHGFAFNVNADLSHFQHIVPCGIKDDDKGVTSLARELDRELDIQEVRQAVVRHFSSVFDCRILT